MINKTPSPSNQKGALPEKFPCHPWFNAALTKKIPSHRKEEKCDDDVHPVVQEARLVDDEENILGTEPERGGSTRLSGETTRTSASLPN